MTFDPVAAIQAAIAARSASGLQIWFIGPFYGEATSIACANETDKAGWLASLRAKGRVILSDNGRAGLAAQYVETIGYDPFADDPSITDAEVARTLVEHQRALTEAVENDCARLMAGTATVEDCDALEAAEMAVERSCPEMLAAIARRRAELAVQ